MTTVFEAVDATDPEQYWTLGVWPTLDDAREAFMVENPHEIQRDAPELDGHLVVEIREREMGFSGVGKVVSKFEWRSEWAHNESDIEWTRTEEKL